MAHKWLIKIQFTAYKVHQYFARVCLRRFMGELFVFCWKTGFPFQNQKSLKKKKKLSRKKAWLNSVWYQFWNLLEIQAQYTTIH